MESTVYLADNLQGRGIGTAIYESLLQELRTDGLHAVMAGMALPNEGSVRLHEKFGFEKVAHFKEVGFKFGRRIDVGYWELFL